jgi:hypothetical protein
VENENAAGSATGRHEDGAARMPRVQCPACCCTAWTPATGRSNHAPVRVLAHIKKLDDSFGQFLVRVSCPCGASRHIEPEALARLVGWSTTLRALAPRMRCSRCGKKAAEVVAVATAAWWGRAE